MNLQDQRFVSADAIYQDLYRKIERLSYLPGEMISENDLCRQYNASRHTVRMALSSLRDLGLVTVYPQRGTFVSLIDLDFISDILFMREAIDQEVVLRVIETGQAKKLYRKLKSNLDAQDKLLASGQEIDIDDFFALDAAFHSLILSAVRSSDASKIFGERYVHFRRYRNLEIQTLNRVSELVRQHHEIAEAIRSEDKAAARKAVHTHLDTIAFSKSVKNKTGRDYFAHSSSE